MGEREGRIIPQSLALGARREELPLFEIGKCGRGVDLGEKKEDFGLMFAL